MTMVADNRPAAAVDTGSRGSTPLVVVILTKDEERHIARAIGSVGAIADRVVVVDSHSTDRTVEIARGLGAEILVNRWVNYATQMNWAFAQLGAGPAWVFRLDADEVVTPELAAEIRAALPTLGPEVAGVYVNRRMAFLGRLIRHGGVFPVPMLRIMRLGRGHCENRWMDEHLTVDGETRSLAGEIHDDNLQPLTWWTQKHNLYACREVVDVLNQEYGFRPRETIARLDRGRDARKRWLKENVYAHTPPGLRAFAYFGYRFVVRGGFLDGWEGTAFHVLQGFWYRFLVDAKLREVKAHMARTGADPVHAIREVLGIDLG